jgi:hypothetical protein
MAYFLRGQPRCEERNGDRAAASGRADATLTLRPLLSGVMRSRRGWFEREPGPLGGLKAIGVGVTANDIVDVPIVAFLLEHRARGWCS